MFQRERHKLISNSARVNRRVIVFLATVHFSISKWWWFCTASVFPAYYSTPAKHSRANVYISPNFILFDGKSSKLLGFLKFDNKDIENVQCNVFALCTDTLWCVFQMNCRWLWSGDPKATDSKWASELLFLSPRSMKVRWISLITCTFTVKKPIRNLFFFYLIRNSHTCVMPINAYLPPSNFLECPN